MALELAEDLRGIKIDPAGDGSSPGPERALRATAGTPDDNRRVLAPCGELL